MKIGWYILLLVAATWLSCSDEQKREEVLMDSGELELAWLNADQNGMMIRDTLHAFILRLQKDSVSFKELSDIVPVIIPGYDSLNKIYQHHLTKIVEGRKLHEKKLAVYKEKYHAFLSWQMLVSQGGVEPATARDDLRQFKKWFTGLSSGIKKTGKICLEKTEAVNQFIEQVKASVMADSVKINL